MADGSSSRASAITRAASKAALAIAAIAVVWNAQAIAVAAIHGYQHWLSPIAARAGIRCRFTPTCSRYAEIVIKRDGIVRGGVETLTRIARCNPLTPPGTRDDP
jgi:putative membrane protein insertion efficiency factor